MAEQTNANPARAESRAPEPSKDWITRARGALHGPLLIGLVAGLIAIALSLFGMVRDPASNPLTVRSLLFVVVVAGGSWGLIAWAIATAAVEAGKD